MMATAKQVYTEHDSLVLHGGEILCMPVNDFEYFLREGSKITGKRSMSLQTSLARLTNDQLRLLKQYNVGLGISVDGPPELNTFRGPRDPAKNKKFQHTVTKNLTKLEKANYRFGTISVLGKHNATPDKLPILIEWAKQHSPNARFNPLSLPFETEFELSPAELKYAWLEIAKAALEDPRLHFSPIREFVDNLLGAFNLSTCIVNRCDGLTTVCKTIMADGELARCDRYFQDGYYYRGANPKQYSRSDMLEQTECSGCKYWQICGGGCPGEGLHGDYRHKTRFCEAYYALYEYLESKLVGMLPNIRFAYKAPDCYEKCGNSATRFDWLRDLKAAGTWRPVPVHNNRPVKQNCGCGTGDKTTHVDTHVDHTDSQHGDNYNLAPPTPGTKRPAI